MARIFKKPNLALSQWRFSGCTTAQCLVNVARSNPTVAINKVSVATLTDLATQFVELSLQQNTQPDIRGYLDTATEVYQRANDAATLAGEVCW